MSTPPAATRAKVSGTELYSKSVDPETWWDAHFERAADEIIDFFGGDGISLTGMRIADIGCGDGIIDLGVTLKANPAQLVGFDIVDTDTDDLVERAQSHDIEKLPDSLFFASSGVTSLPADDDSFDIAISWSAFEHIVETEAILREIRRVLTAQGVLFIQLWPFYYSAHGSHLVDWYPEGFAQYRDDDDEILRRVRSSGNQAMAAEMIEVYRTLNKITLDELHAAIRSAGFKVVKVAVSAETVHIPDSASHLPLSQSAISGVMLLAIPDDGQAEEPEPTDTVDVERVSAASVPEAVDDEPVVAGDPPPRRTLGQVVARVRHALRRLDDILSRYERAD